MSNKFKPGDKVVLVQPPTQIYAPWLYQILTIKSFYKDDSWEVEETDMLFGTYQLMTEKQYNFLDELENLLNEHNAELKVFNKLHGGEIRSVVAAYVDKEPMFILEDFV